MMLEIKVSRRDPVTMGFTALRDRTPVAQVLLTEEDVPRAISVLRDLHGRSPVLKDPIRMQRDKRIAWNARLDSSVLVIPQALRFALQDIIVQKIVMLVLPSLVNLGRLTI